MEQPCPRCGYVSDRPTRFCRQCGTALFNDTDASEATTRNYAPQQAPPLHGQQAAAPPHYIPQQYVQRGATGEPAPETARFYRPPVAPEYPALAPPPEKRARGRMIFLILLLCFLAVGGGIFLIVEGVRRNSTHERWAPAAAIGEKVREQVEREIEAALEKAQRETEKAQRQAEDAARNAPAGPPPPAPPLPPGALPSSLESYKYPGADVQQAVSVLGNDVVKMTTADNLDKVIAHYRKQLGNPITQSREAEGKKVIFQTSGAPSVIVMINPDEDDEDKTAISLVRSNFLPKLN